MDFKSRIINFQRCLISVTQVFEQIKQINLSGTAIVLIEQNDRKVLEMADRGYVLESVRDACGRLWYRIAKRSKSWRIIFGRIENLIIGSYFFKEKSCPTRVIGCIA